MQAMTMQIELRTRNCPLSPQEEKRVRHQLDALGHRVEQFPEPHATLDLKEHGTQRRVTADLRLQLGPQAQHLISHQAAETPDHAVVLAVQDVERQLERVLSSMRGDAAFGVPSRREPVEQRPHPKATGRGPQR
jgi:ribosome-associated translation inhibitor RaiA